MTPNPVADPGLAERKLVAPLWHTAALLVVFAALTVLGFLARRQARLQGPGPFPPVRLVPLQIQAILFEWGTAAWVWFGIRLKGVRIREIVGGQWPTARFIFIDVLLGAGLWLFWAVFSCLEVAFFGPDRSLSTIPYPSGALEIGLALGVALSAGICEEIVFRGYLQGQFRALLGGAVPAVFLQAMVFGMAHVYQGVRLAAGVILYGVLFGALAIWRRSLRPGIMAHVWSDVAARLLRV
jgi:membrane protease YdiL (CAAX protease family)